MKREIRKNDQQQNHSTVTGLSGDSNIEQSNTTRNQISTEVTETQESLLESTNVSDGIPKINIFDEFHIFQDLFPSFVEDEGIPSFINTNFPDTPSNSMNDEGTLSTNGSKMSDVEENMMLKHFFKRLLPLLDAHPSSPWPQLALKYCDFEIAKSCFIALACIHLYETKGAEEFYRTGMVYVNNTMEYLIDYLRGKSDDSENDDDTLDVPKIISNLKKQPIEKQRSNFFVILLLIHVHFLFSVVESGRSALVRNFSELFSAIVKDFSFKTYLEQIDESSTLIANLSWFDTISAVVSPDCRLPFCEETWYGTKNTPKSTIKLMGCPGEILRTISRFCRLRKEMKETYNVVDFRIEQKFNALKYDLLSYRDYVIFQPEMTDYEYEMGLNCAQCWSLAVLVNLYRLVRPDDKRTQHGMINEFISVYSRMESESPLVTQMIWPIFTMACLSCTDYQRTKLRQFIDTLYSTVKMGTVSSIKSISQQCWETGEEWEEILASKEWLASGIDFLVV
jgi:hypothetical protein